MQVLFEKNLAAIGIRLISTRPRHPQTNGKNERVHRTLRQWLRKQPLATTMAELQTQLDRYRHLYNHDRPHQALDGATPRQARTAGIRHTPAQATVTPPAPTRVKQTVLDSRGYIQTHGARINVGREFANLPVTIFYTAGHVMIFDKHNLIRELTIDPTSYYQTRPKP